MSNLEYHVLLALASGPLYGYAIRDAVVAESSRTLTPRAGSLYRVLARLMSSGLVKEVDPVGELPPHPGHARRYYALTPAARTTLLAETRRLKEAAAMAEKRLGVARGRS
jgi:PadR family transcriptional regulator, regulatory protein PadR